MTFLRKNVLPQNHNNILFLSSSVYVFVKNINIYFLIIIILNRKLIEKLILGTGNLKLPWIDIDLLGPGKWLTLLTYQ